MKVALILKREIPKLCFQTMLIVHHYFQKIIMTESDSFPFMSLAKRLQADIHICGHSAETRNGVIFDRLSRRVELALCHYLQTKSGDWHPTSATWKYFIVR